MAGQGLRIGGTGEQDITIPDALIAPADMIAETGIGDDAALTVVPGPGLDLPDHEGIGTGLPRRMKRLRRD